MSTFSRAVDSANDLRFTSERTSLNNERIDRQAKIVERRITISELEKMKREVGVYEKGRDYNQTIDGHGTGERPPTEEEWAQIAAKANVVETISLGSGSEPVPNRVDWSTSPCFPPISNQDGEASCVSWAVAYYTKTFQEAKEHGWNLTGARWDVGGYPTPEYQDRIISPAFVYHLTNWGINTATVIDYAINLVCSIGACSWAKMPWNPSDQATWPSENAWREAAYYRGASTGIEYLPVDSAGGILSLKNLIASGNLAVIRVNSSQFSSLTSEDVWTVDNYAGGHGHVNTIVGYDDNMTYWEGGNWSEGAFKIANSWGVGGWEHVPDGCYWISYKAMSQRLGFVMFYRDRIGYMPTLTSSFRIEHPVRGDCWPITIGMGTHDNPEVSKNFTDYIMGGSLPFCPNNIVFDITEFKDVVPNVYGQLFFMRVYDDGGGTSATGTILYFAVEDTVSSDPPVTTVIGGFVFADLILARPLHDVAVTNVKPSKTVVGQGFDLNVTVTAADVGSSPETFNVTARADAVGINDGLVGYWSFDEGSGTTAHDSSGNHNDGTIYGANWTDGKFGKALSFDGNDDNVTVPGSPSLNNISDAITITAWMKLKQVPTEAYELINAGGYSYIAYAYVADPAGLRFNLGICTAPNVGHDLAQYAIPPYLPYDQWYYVVWMYDSNGYAAIYVDGNPYVSTTRMSGKIYNFGWGLIINDRGLQKGIVDEMRIYNRTLNQQEIRTFASSGAIQTQTVSLTSGSSTTITFSSNTAGFAKGNYTISAYATPLPGETDTEDNTLTDGKMTVTIPGDVDGDRDVDLYDVVKICAVYGSKKGETGYQANYDINNDDNINLYDAVIACSHYGEKT